MFQHDQQNSVQNKSKIGGGGAQWANLDLQAVELNLYFKSIDTQMDPTQWDHISPCPAVFLNIFVFLVGGRLAARRAVF